MWMSVGGASPKFQEHTRVITGRDPSGTRGNVRGQKLGCSRRREGFTGTLPPSKQRKGLGETVRETCRERKSSCAVRGRAHGLLRIPATDNTANHRHFQTLTELPLTSGSGGERGRHQDPCGLQTEFVRARYPIFSELPFPESGYAGLEQRLYIQHQYSDTISTPVICTMRELQQTFSSSSYTTSGDEPTGHHGNPSSGTVGTLHTTAAHHPHPKGLFNSLSRLFQLQ